MVRDLSHAKVYFTTLDSAQSKTTEAALNKAAAFLRRRLAETMKNLRTVPRLNFVYDKSIETGMRLSSLIDAAVANDKKHDD